jgi:hypothetical protein
VDKMPQDQVVAFLDFFRTSIIRVTHSHLLTPTLDRNTRPSSVRELQILHTWSLESPRKMVNAITR